MAKPLIAIAVLLGPLLGTTGSAPAQGGLPAPPVSGQAASSTGGEAPVAGDLVDHLLERWAFLRDHAAARALLVLVAAFVLAKVLDWVVTRVLKRLAARTGSVVDDRIVDMIHGPVVKTTVILGFALAAQTLDLEAPWDSHTRHALYTLVVIVWVPFLFKSITLVLRSASQEPDRFQAVDTRTFPLFDNLAKVTLIAVLIYALISIWQANPAGFLASAGIVGIAVGFAAQDTLSNLIAGVFIVGDAPYSVGDYITLDSGERGRVMAIGLRSTRILTRDDIEIIIPNSVMGKAKITNEAGGPSPSHRIRIKVSVSYESDIDLVRRVLLEQAAANPKIQQEPAPRVRFRAFGESGLDFELLCWIPEPWLRGQVLDAMHTAILDRFRREGIEIPYPKRDLYVRGLPPTLPPVEGSSP